MLIIQNGYECDYEMKLFYKLYFDMNEDIYVYSNFEYKDKVINVYTEIIYNGDTYFDDFYYDFDTENQKAQFIKKIFTASCTKSFCHAAEKIKHINLPWGVMCGIRPAKIVRELMEEGHSDSEVVEILKKIYEVSDEKIDLAYKVAKNEKILLDEIGENSVSIYIGIPFCPTRCLYCSFVSTDIRVSGKYMDPFVDKLLLEIDKTAEVIDKMGAYVENIYIGGGTPTTLEADQLDRLLGTIRENFDLEHVLEFTVEAGRPDSITREKLEVIRKYPVTRISVNPQTMQQKTLDLVGRKHTVEDVEQIFNLARELGFDNINMDLIAGLPGEDAADMQDTLEKIEKLHPDSLTVHALAIKRAAKFGQEGRTMDPGTEITQMVEAAAASAERMGLVPYYLYRQKNIAGNFENVGYAEQDKAGVYNILIMEEKQAILACGAGASTKRVWNLPDGYHIERCENVKDIKQYIARIDEMIERKKALFEKD